MKYFKGAFIMIGVLAFASVVMIGTAGANHLTANTTVTLTCSTASAQYEDFAAADLPITFHITVNGVTHDLISTANTVPNGTATVNISTLTNSLNGTQGTVSGDVTWTGHATHEGASGPILVTCGETPPTTTTPGAISVSPETVVRPPSAPAPAAAVVNASPRLTG